MKREVIRTSDGSSTIRIEEMDENYHSGHGALQEARHVFIQNGIHSVRGNEPLRVFEMGFGTGLNAILTAEYASVNGIQVEYTGIEAYPVEMELISQLNYRELLSAEMSNTFSSMHEVEWNREHPFSGYFKFKKIDVRIEEWSAPAKQFDIVFFDAFGPRAQSEMWEIEILRKMHALLVTGGIFVTYCAKGQLKRDLRSLGFDVEALPGPPGKREMTRGVKR